MSGALARRGEDRLEMRIRVDVDSRRAKEILKSAGGTEVSPYPNTTWNRALGGRAWKRPLARALGVWFAGADFTLHHAPVSPLFDGGRVAEPMPTIVYGRIVEDESGTWVCVLPRGEAGELLVRFARRVLVAAAFLVAARLLVAVVGNSFWRVLIGVTAMLGGFTAIFALSLPLSWLALTPKQRRAERAELLAVLQRVLAPYQAEDRSDTFRRAAAPD